MSVTHRPQKIVKSFEAFGATLVGCRFRTDWQNLEKHEKDKSIAFGLMPPGKYIGQLFWSKMVELGHDRTVYDECKCRSKSWTYKTIEEMVALGIPTE